MFIFIGLVIALVVVVAIRWVKQETRREERVTRKYQIAMALRNIALAEKALWKCLSKPPSYPWFWPTPEELRSHLMDARYQLKNPITGEQELILVCDDHLTGPVLSGRTVIRLVQRDYAVIKTYDQDGENVLADAVLDLTQEFELARQQTIPS